MDEKLKAIFADTKNLILLFKLAENFHRGYCGYQIKNNSMWLYWCKPESLCMDGFVPLPYEMNSEQIYHFVIGWLQNVEIADYKPDTDGSVVKGYEFIADTFCEGICGCNNPYVGVIINPTWIVFGK